MIGDEIAAALPAMRAQAESLMVDSCTIARAGEPVWDDASGAYAPGTEETVYSGPCRVRMPWSDGGKADVGDAAWSISSPILSLPVATSGAVGVGDSVTITACPFDASRVGQGYSITGLHGQTHSTARRFRVEAVARDA